MQGTAVIDAQEWDKGMLTAFYQDDSG